MPSLKEEVAKILADKPSSPPPGKVAIVVEVTAISKYAVQVVSTDMAKEYG